MLDYSALPMKTFDEQDLRLHFDDVVNELSVLTSEFLFREMLAVFDADYSPNMRTTILTGLDTPADPGITYCQFFTLIEGGRGYYTQRSGLDSFELRYTLEGFGVLEYGARTYRLGPGDGFLIDSSQPHTYRTEGDRWLCTVMQLDGPLPRRLFREEAMSGNVSFSNKLYPRFEEDQFDVLGVAVRRKESAGYELSAAIDALLARLYRTKCATASPRKLSGNRAAEALVEHLRGHYREDVKFDDVAKSLYVSRATLFSSFKAVTGTTPYGYLLELRMGRARLLLKTTTMSVADIAADVGFKDAAHFGQMFKKATGMTPLRYRRS